MQDITYHLPSDEIMAPGHLGCGGCGAALAMRLVLKALGSNAVLVIPASCWSVIDGPAPYSAAGVPVMHTPSSSAVAAASGVRAALDLKGATETVVCAWADDGGTFGHGARALTAAADRNENIIYFCCDNEACVHTEAGRGPVTLPTAPAPGLADLQAPDRGRKDLVTILAAHGVPYVATASVAHPDDLVAKVERARHVTGLRFMHVLAPCPPRWGIGSGETVRFGRLAAASRVFPLFEVVEGRLWRITVRPREVPLEDFLQGQGRFRALLADPYALRQAQEAVDRRWRTVLERTLAGEWISE